MKKLWNSLQSSMHPDWGLIKHVSYKQRAEEKLIFSILSWVFDQKPGWHKEAEKCSFLLLLLLEKRNFNPVVISVDVKFHDMKRLRRRKEKNCCNMQVKMLLPSLFSPVHFIKIIFSASKPCLGYYCIYFLPRISLQNISMVLCQRLL